MSTNISRLQTRKTLIAKNNMSTNKENMNIQRSNTFAKDKKDGCKSNKGLSIKAENCFLNPTTQMQKSFLGETKFKIHHDHEEYSRSRPRMRKDTIHTNILYRPRSSSNGQNRISLDTKTNINSKFQRSNSENMQITSQNAQWIRPVSLQVELSKTKQLSCEVKKRTFSSIKMWKDKMRNSSGAIPKNLADKYPKLSNIDKVDKIKQCKNFIAERTKILPQSSSNLQSEIDYPLKQNENIKKSVLFKRNKLLPSKVVSILQENNLLNAQIDIQLIENKD